MDIPRIELGLTTVWTWWRFTWNSLANQTGGVGEKDSDSISSSLRSPRAKWRREVRSRYLKRTERP